MNKEQQIEEIAKIIKAEYEQWLDTTGVIPKATTYYAECLGCAIDSAEALYNAGYLKGETISCQVTVDSSLLDHINQLADRLVEIRNETAEEILLPLRRFLIKKFDYFGTLAKRNEEVNSDNRLFDLGEQDMANCTLDRVNELLEKYGVEVEE